MKKNKDFTTLAILAAAIAIYFATRPKQQTPPPAATSGLLRRPLHDVA